MSAIERKPLRSASPRAWCLRTRRSVNRGGKLSCRGSTAYPTRRLGATRTGRTAHGAGTLTLSACSRPGYPPLSEIVQPMTQTADVPARDSVSQILCAAADLEQQLVALPSRTAHLNEALDDSLIPRLKIKRPTAAALPWIPPSPCAPGAMEGAIGSQISRPMPAVSNCVARALYLSRTRVEVCGCVRIWVAPPRWLNTTRPDGEWSMALARWHCQAVASRLPTLF